VTSWSFIDSGWYFSGRIINNKKPISLRIKKSEGERSEGKVKAKLATGEGVEH
jgi:hypothetical protein